MQQFKDRKFWGCMPSWISTIVGPQGPVINQQTKFQQKPTIPSRVILGDKFM